MDISKIKNLVKQNGDKFIFVENGEPEVVMMSFGEYQKLTEHNAKTRTPHNLSGVVGQAYANTADYRPGFAGLRDEEAQETEFITPMVAESAGLPIRLEDIRLEDLPI
ncbi:MAG: hypothetical protein HYW91_02620 [Candidatus Sungbacteria bacterium]|nr:hypothetical protein [Candidatus Sungbacteria bacterium]